MLLESCLRPSTVVCTLVQKYSPPFAVDQWRSNAPARRLLNACQLGTEDLYVLLYSHCLNAQGEALDGRCSRFEPQSSERVKVGVLKITMTNDFKPAPAGREAGGVTVVQNGRPTAFKVPVRSVWSVGSLYMPPYSMDHACHFCMSLCSCLSAV